jgi:putative transposase
MRQARLKVDPASGAAAYHCVTRTVNGEWLFDEPAREVLRRELWLVAEYCGLEILTYAILSNHFHVLVRVPQKAPIPDQELLRRYRLLYPRPTRYRLTRLEVIERELLTDGPEAERWRRQQLALMGDLSPFMQLVKQRFSIWFNHAHRRFGTLWAERFKSLLVESGRALTTMAAYIDLNGVRAGLVDDPKDYRFCGYAEAVANNEKARQGLANVVGGRDWASVQASYRQILFSTATEMRERGVVLPLAALRRALLSGGRLSVATVLRCRVRYFTDGAVLGSRAFVETQLAAYRARTGQGQRCAARPMPAVADWGDLATLRRLRDPAFG